MTKLRGVRITAIAMAVAAGALGPAGALALSRPSYDAPPSWVDIAPLTNAPAAPDGSAALQVLLDDNQSKLSPTGDAFYNRRVVKVVKAEGLSFLNSRTFTWSPDTEDVAIHTLRILRDGAVIDLLNGGKDVLVLRRETNLENAMLDGRLTATRQIDGLQVGDVLDVAWTVFDHDPALQGHSHDSEGIGSSVIGRYRVRTLWPSTQKIRWQASEGFGQPTVTTKGRQTELLLDVANAKAPQPAEGSPPRYHLLGRLEATSFQTWEEVGRVFFPLFQKAEMLGPSSPLKAEAAAIAARSADPKVRAFEALRLVEDKTRYFYLGINDGGYVPAAADSTWARRFGDCKAKTVLLLALLKELGIEAEPALVSTDFGDVLEHTVPGPALFDHVIVRATIGGQVYWLDGTREGDRGGLDALHPPSWRWALPLRAGGAPLTPIAQRPLDAPMMEILMRLDASKGIGAPAPTLIRMRMRGELASPFRQMIARGSREDIERAVRRSFSRSMSWVEPKDVAWQDDPDTNTVELSMTGSADMDWRTNADLGVKEFKVPGSRTQTSNFPRREAGPDHDAPYATPFPMYVRSDLEVVLPDKGNGYSVRGPTVDQTIAGFEIKDSATIEDGVAHFRGAVRTLAPEAPAAEAEAANKLMARLANEDNLIREGAKPPAPAAH